MIGFPYRRIGIAGAGRVAAAMGLALTDRSGEPIYVWGRDTAKSKAAAAAIGRAEAVVRLADLVEGCDLIILALSDDALDQTIRNLMAIGRESCPFVFHVSGRSGAALLDPLREQGWRTAAIHPAMTFTGQPASEVRQMMGARFAVTGSTQEAAAEARVIVDWLGGVPVDIAEAHRPLYHAALCHGANHLVTLIAGSCKVLAAAGVDDPAALLAPLVRAALENALNKGMDGLSGPLLRGDTKTVSCHIDALRRGSPSLLAAYSGMALATLDALARQDSMSVSAECRTVLQPDQR